MINADLMRLAKEIVYHCRATDGGTGMMGQVPVYPPTVPAKEIPGYCDEIIFVYRYLIDNAKRERAEG